MHFAQYDTGQAVAHFTVQAHAEDLATHQMGGFDRDAVRKAFDLSETLTPLTVIAVGTLGSLDDTSDEVRARENTPRTRRAISDSVLINS
jgi:nitroreductase